MKIEISQVVESQSGQDMELKVYGFYGKPMHCLPGAGESFLS
jgi:hypothetical protein